MADKMEIVFLGVFFRNPKTAAVLPNIAFLARNTVTSVILMKIVRDV